MSRTGLTVGVLWALVLRPVAAGAQPAPSWADRLSLGGELSASIAPADPDAFFNYYDYDYDGLRTARLRLFAEYRMVESLSLVAEGRLDNAYGLDAAAWYVRWRPRRAWNLDLQIGRIPPVLGAFARRAYGRDNPLLGAPLGYQYLTSLRADALPIDAADVLRMRGRGWRPSYPLGSDRVAGGVPLIASGHWDTGAQARWGRGGVELAGAITRGSPAAPVVEDDNDGLQWSGRASALLPGGLTFGVSGAVADWLADTAVGTLPATLRDHRSQRVVALDAEWGRGPWLLRSEWMRASFDVPIRDAPDPRARLVAWAGFLEGQYRPHVRWQVAARAGRLQFSHLTAPDGRTPAWDAPVTRLEGVVTYRVTRHLEVRAGWQHDWRSGGRVRARGFPMVGALLWF